MEANEKNLLVSSLCKQHNKTEEEILDLLYQQSDDSDEVTLKEGALDWVLDADAERVKKLKKPPKPDDKALKEAEKKGYSRGKSETLRSFEDQLRTTYEIETKAEGLDLVKEIVSTVSECELNENIKTHPAYLELEKNRIPKDQYDKLQTEFDDFKLNQDRLASLVRIKQDALKILLNKKPVESDNSKVAENRRKDFLSKLDPYEFDIADDGNHLIKKDGSRLEDKHGNPLKFDDFIGELAGDHYDFLQSDPKGQAGNIGGNGSGGKIDVPKTEVEYLKMMAERIAKGDREGTVKLRELWESQNK